MEISLDDVVNALCCASRPVEEMQKRRCEAWHRVATPCKVEVHLSLVTSSAVRVADQPSKQLDIETRSDHRRPS